MARRSLRPQLNQIRTWVRQGRTDAWIAHQLEVTTNQIATFKRENELSPEGEAPEGAAGVDFDDEIDLRAEDDALIAAELEAEAARAEESGDEESEDEARATRTTTSPSAAAGAGADAGAGPARAARLRRPRSRGRSTTARRATDCGSTRRWPTARSMQSTGRATGPSR